MATVTVTMSGPLLATLLYEHSNGQGDQEGFLLGEVASRITDTISDAQLHGEKEETNLKICSVVPCEPYQFYDNSCRLDLDRLTSLLGDTHKEVVGWYRFRRQSTLQVSLRERAVHRRLAHFLAQRLGDPHLFLLALFRGATSSNDATHSVDHVFLRSVRGSARQYGAVPLHLVNLGEPGHSDYHLYPGSAASIHRGSFSRLLASAPDASPGAVTPMLHLHEQLRRKLQDLQLQVAESEAQVAARTREVAQLRERCTERPA